MFDVRAGPKAWKNKCHLRLPRQFDRRKGFILTSTASERKLYTGQTAIGNTSQISRPRRDNRAGGICVIAAVQRVWLLPVPGLMFSRTHS